MIRFVPESNAHFEPCVTVDEDDIPLFDSLNSNLIADMETYKKVRNQKGVKSQLVIFLDKTPLSTLTESAKKSNVTMKIVTEKVKDSLFLHKLLLNNEIVSRILSNKRKMKINAGNILFQQALVRLIPYCFLVNTNINAFTVVNKEMMKVSAAKSIENYLEKATTPDPVALQNGIGAKILGKMNWNGKGLGKCEQGIETHITPKLFFHGHAITKTIFKDQVSSFLNNYVYSDKLMPLKFDSKFTRMEKQYISMYARHLKLEVYGEEVLCVKKNLNSWTLVYKLIEYNFILPPYSLIPPLVV